MGVPAFFRWLSQKYASVCVPCVEEKAKVVDGVRVPVDASLPNPNGVEFDNLYLDMNGIIHPCTHPEDKPAPKNEDEMMVAIFECIDRIFAIIRPRMLVYMAIDGVAPRAKMNQQRSRRFRASKETSEKILEIARLREELTARGCFLPPEKPKGEHFDSNCITPGTPFMARLSACLHYYVHDRMNNDPAWKGVKVILSDANVPGEGEHKIMDYIRRQRAQPDHNPNTQHCLCGADADLIMLGLATHEPNFTIIREEFRPNQPRPCDLCGQIGHEMADCQGLPKNPNSLHGEVQSAFGSEGDFIFVRLNILREYLEKELAMPNLPFTYDFERAVDDWVFMCFFVGNDFLPHLPSLEIREGAIDRLVNLYKEAVYKTGGYITDSGDVNLDRVQLILAKLGEAEDEIFKQRQKDEISFRKRMKQKNRYNNPKPATRPSFALSGQFAPTPLGKGANPGATQNARQEAYLGRTQGMHTSAGGGGGGGGNDSRGEKRKFDQTEDSDEDDAPNDEVRLWEDGFKNRYYESKFDVDPDNLPFRYTVAFQYVRGLCWVLRYYYQGCASWKWYFPYHYAPFASDFVDIGQLSTEFEKDTKPFRPLEQLMGVFPAASSSHVPQPWADLMSNPESPIIDFYPVDFKIDLNGKKFAWMGVALLPFVEESRLFKAVAPYYDKLTAAEVSRNVRGDDRLYLGAANSGYAYVNGLYENDIGSEEVDIMVDGMRGKALLAKDCVPQGGTLRSPVQGLDPLYNNTVLTVSFRDLKFPDSFVFPAIRLKGAKEPPKVLKPIDFEMVGKRGRGRGGGWRGNGGRGGGGGWRPQIGMAPATQYATLDSSGHRMLGHYQNRGPAGAGQYSNVPPSLNSLQPTLNLAREIGSNHQSNRGYRGGGGGHRGGGGGYGGGGYGGGGGGYGGSGGYNRGGGGYGGGGGGGGGNRYHPYKQGGGDGYSTGNNTFNTANASQGYSTGNNRSYNDRGSSNHRGGGHQNSHRGGYRGRNFGGGESRGRY